MHGCVPECVCHLVSSRAMHDYSRPHRQWRDREHSNNHPVRPGIPEHHIWKILKNSSGMQMTPFIIFLELGLQTHSLV